MSQRHTPHLDAGVARLERQDFHNIAPQICVKKRFLYVVRTR
jgi:hypothetical protein